jgi:hypothetical protein
VGDWIVGLSPKASGNRVVYAMQVEEILRFEDYYRDERFAAKIPDMDSKDVKRKCGDNIYEPLQDEGFRQVCPCMHSNGLEQNPKKMQRDLSGKNVLISKNFHYFGSQGPELPSDLNKLKVGRAYRNSFSEEIISRFLQFIAEHPKGISGQPSRWPKNDQSWKPKSKCG